MKPLFIMLVSFCMLCSWSNTNIEVLLKDAKSFDEQHKEELALKKFREVLQIAPDNLTALCGASINSVRVGNREKNDDKKRELFEDGLSFAKKAISINSQSDEANFCMAAALGRKAESLGAKEKLSLAKEIKKYADKCVQINSSHAGGHHIIGRWHHRFSNLSFFEKAAANTLFGGIPNEVSVEKGLYHLKKACELKPTFILYLYDYAVALNDADKEEEALAILKKAVSLKSQTPDDSENLNKCRDLIYDIQ